MASKQDLSAKIESLKAANPTTVNGKTVSWPVKPCNRCGGCGRYSYNPMDGDRCYGCGGTGVQSLNKKVAEIRAEYAEALRVQQRPCAGQLKVGDRMAVYNGERRSSYDGERGDLACEGLSGRRPGNVEYVTLTGVDIVEGTPERNMGYSSSGGDVRYVGFVTLRYEIDGAERVVNTSTNNCFCRANDGQVDANAYLERAWEAAATSRAAR